MDFNPMHSSSSYEYFNVTAPCEYVAHVEINRPRKRNSFIRAMWLEMRQIFETLSNDASVRCIMLSGAGEQAFCSGLDVQEAMNGPLLSNAKDDNIDGARKANLLRHSITEFQTCIGAIETCAKPVIALLHGYCFGLGLDIALAADIRLCSRYGSSTLNTSPAQTSQTSSSSSPKNAFPKLASSSSSSSSSYSSLPSTRTLFSIKEVDIGLAADIGTLSRLPRAGVSMSWAKEVCLTAREFGAEEAVRVGLVSCLPSQRSGGSSGGSSSSNNISSKRNNNDTTVINDNINIPAESLPNDKQDLLAQGLKLASVIASKSPVAVQGTKELLNVGRDKSVDESLRYTAIWNSAMLQTDDIKRSIAAFTTGRKPTYEKL